MVINICHVKDGDWGYVEREITKVFKIFFLNKINIFKIVKVCSKQACVKVIIGIKHKIS